MKEFQNIAVSKQAHRKAKTVAVIDGIALYEYIEWLINADVDKREEEKENESRRFGYRKADHVAK